MTQTQTSFHTGRTQKPEILELLSELEKRDKASKGDIQSGAVAGAILGDPRGFTVVNATGHDVGKVDDLYVDPNSRVPYYALLQLGNNPLGIGDRRILVDISDIELAAASQVRVRVAL